MRAVSVASAWSSLRLMSLPYQTSALIRYFACPPWTISTPVYRKGLVQSKRSYLTNPSVPASATISPVLHSQKHVSVFTYSATLSPDEILYQARVHPAQRCNTLYQNQIEALHHHISDVCHTAVEANADDTKYPEHWLFKHRWVPQHPFIDSMSNLHSYHRERARTPKQL